MVKMLNIMLYVFYYNKKKGIPRNLKYILGNGQLLQGRRRTWSNFVNIFRYL